MSSMLAQMIISGGLLGLAGWAPNAAGFQITHAATKTENFAQGSLSMFGGMLSATLAPKIGYFWSLPATLLACALMGLAIYWVAIAPHVKRGSDSWIAAGIGCSYLITGICDMAFGKDELSLDSPFGDDPLRFLSVNLTPHEIFAAGVAIAVAIAWALFNRSRMGKEFQAVAENKRAAQLQGIPAGAMAAGAFMASGALAGLAGWAIAPMVGAGLTTSMMGVMGFIAAATASMSSPRGAYLVAILMGVAGTLTSFYLSSELRLMPAYLACAIVFALRPNGVFGKPTSEKV